jgi:hypothetical protein
MSQMTRYRHTGILMKTYRIILVSIAIYLVGCTGANNLGKNKQALAATYHINIADSLLMKSELQKATNEYLYITKQYSTTKYYLEAVRKTAILYSNPQNPIADDSTSLYWYHVYLTLPISNQEKENTNSCIVLLERIKLLREELRKLREVDMQMNKKEIK